ncbi:MAG: type II toxin-antitoxin system VapC family toxin [Candidatus Woesearchaeota archaeon]
MRIYIDTNVYLDFFLERSKSRHAERLFRRTLNCHHHIILSDHLSSELTLYIDHSKIKILFEMLKNKIILVKSEKEDEEKARLLPTHYADALHIILARKADAEAIVTNNIKDFSSIFKSKRPEDL